jgi:hypothetical protein|nr:MAG TPA: hypothetical protein [Bacteriophage sp.]
MLTVLKHLPLNVREQLHNEEVASELFPKIMDNSCGSYRAPHNTISGWCQYIRPNGVSFWVYVDDNGAVCIETEAVRNATNMMTVDRDFDIDTSKNELTRFLEQIAPWILDCNFRQAIIRSSQGILLFFSENGMTRWIFRVWGPKRWLLCNHEYDHYRI